MWKKWQKWQNLSYYKIINIIKEGGSKIKMNKKSIKENRWKIDNKKYLFELQKFLDLADNIEDEELRKIIISQMLKCDKCLTEIAEEEFEKLKKI